MSTGLCECGCGQPTPVALGTHRKYGWVKGQPKRFILGHRANLQRMPVVKDDRSLHVDGRKVHLHVLRAERALGKPLPPGAVVHHADGSKRDDAPLVICENQAYHFLLHVRMRVQRAGGNPNIEALCGRCRTVKPHSDFGIDRSRVDGRDDSCRACNNAKEKKKRAQYSELAAIAADRAEGNPS